MLSRSSSPLDRPFSVRVDPGIDLGAMQAACNTLAGEHDFTAFALAGGSHTNPRRTIFSATVEESGEDLWFRVTGSGFLRGMVRSLVGTLLEVGTGRRSPDGFGELLGGAPRSAAGPTAPARGLTLENVVYGPPWALVERAGSSGAMVI
jgi:tRNA pseudouridine38-40 synthase